MTSRLYLNSHGLNTAAASIRDESILKNNVNNNADYYYHYHVKLFELHQAVICARKFSVESNTSQIIKPLEAPQSRSRHRADKHQI